MTGNVWKCSWYNFLYVYNPVSGNEAIHIESLV